MLSISWDPSSAPKINKFLCTVLFREYKGERRERLPTQGGDASNSAGVLTRLSSSRAMLVFLCDSTGVLSRLGGSGATPEMKLEL